MSVPRRIQPARLARWEAPGAPGPVRVASQRLSVFLLILANLALPISLRAEPADCVFDYECDDCNPCTRDECFNAICTSAALDECAPCGDGLFCNGTETCDGAGVCAGGELPCAASPELVCDEEGGDFNQGACVEPCRADADCDDGLYCTGDEVCTLRECVGGTSVAAPCVDDSDCAGGGLCGGVCRSPDAPCGRASDCVEAQQLCTQTGRCCKPNGDCVIRKKPACLALGGLWLDVGDRERSPLDEDTCDYLPIGGLPKSLEDFECPSYASGLAPGGAFPVEVGPIGAASCLGIREIGDDYSMPVSDPSRPFFQVRTVRFMGAIKPESRIRLRFYDLAGTLVADFESNAFVATEAGLITMVPAPRQTIPVAGWMTVESDEWAAPEGRLTWFSTDDVDVGSNDPSQMWVNGAPVTDFLPGVPDVLAFEIVGLFVEPPLGACCLAETGECALTLPWLCDGFFPGAGVECRACANDPFAPCQNDTDCPTCATGGEPCRPHVQCPDGTCEGGVCVGGAGAGLDCDVNIDCDPGDTCDSFSACLPLPPVCSLSACCDQAGGCTEVLGRLCSEDGITACSSDSDCTGTCESPCPPGTESLGSGSACQPNCCQQPVATGADHCENLTTIQQIPVPVFGDPPVIVTRTGEASGATLPESCPFFADDRVWWEAFEVDDCAFVTIDLCCSEPVNPAPLTSLVEGCPCNRTIPLLDLSRSYFPPPSSCPNDDNERFFYGALPAGTYYIPIRPAPRGAATPYQLHITVSACGRAACCTGSTCTVLNEVECDEQGGAFLGSLDPSEPFFSPVCPDTPGGLDDPCFLGACCTGQGRCEGGEFKPCKVPGSCIDEATCVNVLGGTFQGGTTCLHEKARCSSCLIADESNCQFPAQPYGSGFLSDLTVPPNGVVAADDFVPQGTTLTQLCVWGFYHDATLTGADRFDCMDAVEDEFRVRVYADDHALPGALIGEALVTGANIFREAQRDTGFENLYDGSTNAIPMSHTLTLDTPITGLVPGERHWLEVANNTTGPTRAYATCWWNWLQHFPDSGDGYCASGANSGGVDDPAAYLPGQSRYIHGSGRMSDLAFCLETTDGPLNFDSGPQVTAACWSCAADGPPTCTIETALNCASDEGVDGIWNRLDPDCSGSFFDTSDFLRGDTCYGASPQCGNGTVDSGEECDDGNLVSGDGCDAECMLECPGPGALQDGARVITNGLHAVNTNCTNTDGPSVESTEFGFGSVGNDVWFHYTSTCTGRLVVNGCPSQPGLTQNGYDTSDGVIALYHDPDDPTTCICPGASAIPLSGSFASDEGCNGIFDTGTGIVERIVLPGECYTIRVTNWGPTSETARSGPGMIDVDCIEPFCQVSSLPVVERIANEFGVLVDNTKNRFLSITSADVAASQAIRVTFIDLPPPYRLWNGRKLWVSEPSEFAEASTLVVDPDGPTFLAATLQCDGPAGDPTMSLYRDWNALGIVHVFHEGIIPGGIYSVELIGEGCPLFYESFSEVFEMTTSNLGDTMGNCIVFPCTPANGTTSVSDILSIIGKFASAPSAIAKVRADLEPPCVDFKINISDVLQGILGFTGQPYPFAPSATDPCDATCAGP